MPKERSFLDRVNYYQQQADNQNQSDLISRQQHQQQESERQRQEDVRKQQEYLEKVKETKEIFAGTGIIEAFQEIIDKKILLWAHVHEIRFKKGFLGGDGKREDTKIDLPAQFIYNGNEIGLAYDLQISYGSDGLGGTCSSKIFHFIKVSKKSNSTFEVDYSRAGGLFQTEKIYTNSDMDNIIDNIALFVQKNKAMLYPGTFDKNFSYPSMGDIDYNPKPTFQG